MSGESKQLWNCRAGRMQDEPLPFPRESWGLKLPGNQVFSRIQHANQAARHACRYLPSMDIFRSTRDRGIEMFEKSQLLLTEVTGPPSACVRTLTGALDIGGSHRGRLQPTRIT